MEYSREIVINILKTIAKDSRLENIQLGLFGSFARNDHSTASDVDVVLKSASPLLLVYDGIEDMIQGYVKENLGLACDVIDYTDLEMDYEEAKELGIEEYTLKPTVDKEVIWIG